MDRLNLFLAAHWFSLLALVAAAALGVVALVWRRGGVSLAVAAVVLGLAGAGGLALPFDWAIWVAAAGGAGLFLMLLALITSAWWSAVLATALGAVTLVGL